MRLTSLFSWLRFWKFWVFLAASGALTVWIGLQILGVSPGQDQYQLTASFADATNLRAGDPVRLAGVPVGQVNGVRVEAGRAIVSFDIDDDVRFPDDSEVAVRSQNLIGLRELLITPGDGTQMLDGGETMTVTDDAVELGALVNELGPLLEAVNPQRLNELNAVLVETLSGNRGAIADVTSDLQGVLDQLASRAGTIQQLLDDYEVVAGEVARRDAQIEQIIDNLVLLSETFTASEDVLVQTLDELPGFTDELSSLLADNAQNLDAILADLADVLDTVQSNQDVVTDFVDLAPPSLRDLIDATDEGNFLYANFLCIELSAPPCDVPALDGSLVPPPVADLVDALTDLLGLTGATP